MSGGLPPVLYIYSLIPNVPSFPNVLPSSPPCSCLHAHTEYVHMKLKEEKSCITKQTSFPRQRKTWKGCCNTLAAEGLKKSETNRTAGNPSSRLSTRVCYGTHLLVFISTRSWSWCRGGGPRCRCRVPPSGTGPLVGATG